MDRKKRDAEIVRLVEQRKLTLREIGQKHGVSYQRVSQVAKAAGVVRGHPTIDHDKLFDALLLVRNGLPLSHAAEMKGLCVDGFAQALMRRGLYTPSRQQSEWDDTEVTFLRKHYKQPGWTAQRIADKLGRTKNETIGKANRLGLRDEGFMERQTADVANRRQRVRELHANGVRLCKIALMLKVPHYIVSRDMKQAA